jgi:vancomycin resistance protein VanJ
VRIGCVHLPTPREGFDALLNADPRFVEAMARERDRRDVASKDASRFLIAECRADVIAGDFNLPVESRIFQTHRRESADAFGISGFGAGHTKLTRWHGVRIDHVLIRNNVIKPVRSLVGPNLGSDHCPVFAEVALPTGRD